MTALDTVTARLTERTGYTGRKGSWRCPAHDDRNPSLSVSNGDGKVLLHCHAGCDTAAILTALGLEPRDLFDQPHTNGNDIVATYDYVDENDNLLFQVVRYTGKRFVQRRPDGNGGWIWNIRGVRRPLYRLPEVDRAVREGRQVFVVEGEKDVDRLAAEGYVATTNPHGAGKWRPEYNTSLAGADIVIVADRDDAGRAHARDVARQLDGIADRVRIFEPIERKDISDHLAAGHKVKDLKLVDLNEPEIPPLVVVTLEEFAAVDEPGAQALLGDGSDALIPANGDVMFYGDGGAGKTTLTVDLGCHLAAGDDWLGITVPRPLTILVVENEGPRPLFRAKLRRKNEAWAGSDLGGRVRVVETPWATLTFADETHRGLLAQTIADHGCDVVLIGPVSKSGMTEAGTLAEVRGFTELVADVRHRAGRSVTFILVHHENRAGTPSGAWEGAVDTLFHVQGRGHGHTRLYVQKARWSSTHHATSLELNWTDGEGFEVDVKPEISDDDIADRITTFIAENPGTGWTKVAEATRGIRATRRNTIRDGLLGDGLIVNIVKQEGVLVAIDHCPPKRQAQLYPASDPTIAHLLPDPEAAGKQSASPTDGAPTASASLLPDTNREAGREADAGEPSELFNTTDPKATS